ncbi:MAG TPA: hypothetical protein PLE74_02215 [Candidatus Cloacimonadota bacterium]|nr:hypothetical protein [Candidatus Cloacimonadota bacterium]
MKTLLLFVTLIMFAGYLSAAVGCDLNDPDRDVKKLFPDNTGYKTLYVSIAQKGGTPLLTKIEQRLGDKFQGLYETADVPYTMYQIYKGKELIGYIHGVNQKGKYGGIQVFLALDKDGVIKSFYIQKITSPNAKKFRDAAFGKQFIGLSLKDFYEYNIQKASATPDSKINRIKNPDPKTDDFKVIMRAVKKNLILTDEFLLNNKYLKYMK